MNTKQLAFTIGICIWSSFLWGQDGGVPGQQSKWTGAHRTPGTWVDYQEVPIGNGYDWKLAYSKHSHLSPYAQAASQALIAYRGVLSNFQRVSIIDPISGTQFLSGEQMYQYHKFPPNHPGRTAVWAAKTPKGALLAARKHFDWKNGHAWEKCNKTLMVYIQLVKALEDQTGMYDLLNNSGTDFIIEDTSSRHYSNNPEKRWGDNGDGKGENWLGWAQMQARDLIQAHSKPIDAQFVSQYYNAEVKACLDHYYKHYK